MKDIVVGDLVRVVGGPAYLPGSTLIKGTVVEVFDAPGGPAALVKTASGGEWGFQARDLELVSRDRRLIPEEQRRLYRSGRWSCPPPPVPTALWDEDAWIRYIDRMPRVRLARVPLRRPGAEQRRAEMTTLRCECGDSECPRCHPEAKPSYDLRVEVEWAPPGRPRIYSDD